MCHMAKAPPSGGEWSAWYARFCRLLNRYHERLDDAGRLTRRLQREMASLWVFLREQGVEPTNNRAERSLRFAVMWRKGSSGLAWEINPEVMKREKLQIDPFFIERARKPNH